MNYDFSGYATKNDLKCTDGRTIRKDAFKHNDGVTVPLVWQHMHNDPTNILGYAKLENRPDGVYTYGVFNSTPAGQNAKELVKHGDITSLSIFANNLNQKGKDVMHGNIREVSLVLAGANPGAFIDNLAFAHGDGSFETDESEAIIFTGLDLSLEMQHKDEPEEEPEAVKHEDKPEEAKPEEDTVQEVFDTLSEKQKNVVYLLLGEALSHSDKEELEHSNDGGETMKKNVFEKEVEDATVLSHADFEQIIQNTKNYNGSFKEALLAHADTYGIKDIDFLFPDAKTITNTPDMITRDMAWVQEVLNGTRHSPFSRIKSVAADITADEARAKGYVTGAYKKEELIKLLKRVTTPTTVYKKQKLDRDDIVDITDFDVVSWLKLEMRTMFNEELARAVLIGDGREIDDEDKINEDNIRPIAFDNALYAHPVVIAPNLGGNDIIEAILRARPSYKGTGQPVMFTTETLLTDLLLLKDKVGRRLYETEASLATALRVAKIVTVEPMDTVPNLLAILVNLKDYTIGADKGGEINLFDDFDIDYNQYKYLLEGRSSGALTKPKSALVIKRAAGTQATPTVPTFVASTGVLTVPSVTGVEYYKDDSETALTAGAQTAVAGGISFDIIARPAEGYYFPHNFDADWTFTSTKA